MTPEWYFAKPNECWFSALQPRYRADINYVLEFGGALDEERLDRALRGAIAAEPSWGYRFVEHWLYPYWRRLTSAQLRSLVVVRETADVCDAVHAILSTPLDAAARFWILRQPGRDTLLLRTDHRLGDGTAGRLLLEEVRHRYHADAAEPNADFLGPVIRRTYELFRVVSPAAQRRRYLKVRTKLQQQLDKERAFEIPPTTETDPYSPPQLLRYGPGAAVQLQARALEERATCTMVVQAAACVTSWRLPTTCPSLFI